MIKALNKIKNDKGAFYVEFAFGLIILFMILAVIVSYMQTKQLAKKIREEVEVATVENIINNYTNVYSGGRQKVMRAYKFDSTDWQQIVNNKDILGIIGNKLNLTINGGKGTLYNKEKEIKYIISDLEIKIENLEKTEQNALKKFNAEGSCMLTVPKKIFDYSYNLKLKLNIKAGYLLKY